MDKHKVPIDSIQSLEQWHPCKGDVIILRYKKGVTVRQAKKLREMLGREFWLRNVRAHVLCLPEDRRIEFADEDEMRAQGWVRKWPALERLP